jgi:hypothetical protein
VFPTKQAAGAAGYETQEASDLFAIYSPKHVGIVANNIPQYRRRQGAETFGQLQSKRLRVAQMTVERAR